MKDFNNTFLLPPPLSPFSPRLSTRTSFSDTIILSFGAGVPDLHEALPDSTKLNKSNLPLIKSSTPAAVFYFFPVTVWKSEFHLHNWADVTSFFKRVHKTDIKLVLSSRNYMSFSKYLYVSLYVYSLCDLEKVWDICLIITCNLKEIISAMISHF